MQNAYVTAALPSKGIYVALAAIAWVVMPATVGRKDFTGLLIPILKVVALGVALAAGMTIGVAAIGVLLGRDAPSRPLVFLLGTGMALAGASWLVLQLRMARLGVWLWVAPGLALAIGLGVAVVGHTQAWMTAGVLGGQFVALVVGVAWLHVDLRPRFAFPRKRREPRRENRLDVDDGRLRGPGTAPKP